MIIERKPIEFDETDIIKETIIDLADDYHLLADLIGDKVYYELCNIEEYEREHITDLLIEKMETLLKNFAKEITKEKLEEKSNV